MKSNILLLVIGMFLIVSCSKVEEPIDNDPSTPKDINSLQVSSTFNYQTDVLTLIELKALANDNAPLANVKFSVYNANPEEGGQLMVSGITNQSGVFSTKFPIPAFLSSVYVTTPYIGLPHDVEVSIVNKAITHVFGGKTMNMKSGGRGVFKSSLMNISYMGTFNTQGVPNYLEPVNEVIDPQFMADINASFPESVAMNPSYISNTNEHDFKLIEACDVWVAFVSEGAGYKNTLGYYTYDLNNPPTSANDIAEGMIIFPNTSFVGSGGGLNTGNQVYLGQFPAGTGIGFFLKSNAFNNGTVGNGYFTYYSNPAFNPEPDPNKKKHNVVLIDPARDLFLMGFEDLKRDANSDEDFNDALFIVKANPIENVETDGFPTPDYTGPDADGDGVTDNLDDYPNDPTKAFNNYYPAKNTFGSLAYEDLWPSRGDYDFNDMVVDYNINQITNAQNKVVQVKPIFVLRAFGASFHNGFGFQLSVEPNAIASITGQELTEGLITLNANNTEAGQSKAVVMVFDDAYNIMPYPGGGVIGVNTDPAGPWVTPDTLKLTVNLSSPVSTNVFGYPPYNPFIFIKGDRSREAHLSDFAPTDLANMALFGTEDDDSNPATGRYYKTANNLPWGINLVEKFDYPIEKAPITEAHLKFGPWAESNGALYPDWFQNKPGYRNDALIY
jgi:LruC domain-containing protein